MANLFQLLCDALPPNAAVLGFRGDEEISRPFRFEIAVWVPLGSELDAASIIGNKASLIVPRPLGAYTVHGIIRELELFHEYVDHAILILTLTPRMSRLELDRHSRVFTEQSIPDIVRSVLTTRGLGPSDVEIDLTRQYPVRDHVCQYRETDLAFVQRLLEKEGIAFFFQHSEGRDVLVITDDPNARADLAGGTVRFQALNVGDAPAQEAFATFRQVASAVTALHVQRDYDYLRPQLDVAGAATIVKGEAGTSNVVFGETGHTPAQAQVHALVRAEHDQLAQAEFTGWGRVYELRTGYTFRLDDHPRATLNIEYLATRIQHTGNDAAGDHRLERRLSLSADQPYLVTVGCVPRSVPFRPARSTPWPRIPGVVEGTVDGPVESDFAQIDEHGRYKVRLKFDESGLPDAHASMWVRMLQPHAGNPEGFHFPLRKHTEVHVMFTSGDPDRPIIVGAVPNALTPSVVTSENHTQNVIMTGGSNRLEMEDKSPGQYVTLSSPTLKSFLHLGAGKYNFVAHTLGDGLNYYGGDLEMHTVGHKTEEVEATLTETFRDRSQTTVHRECFKDYLDTFDMNVRKKATYLFEDMLETHVQGGVKTKIDKTFELTVDGDVSELFRSNHNLEVFGATSMKLKGGRNVEVTGVDYTTATGDQTVRSDANQLLQAGANQTVNAGGQQTLSSASQLIKVGGQQKNEVGSHFTETAGPFVVYSGPMFEAWANGDFKVTAAGGNGLVSAHGTLSLQASANIVETAVTILIKGDGTVNIEGGTVNIKGGLVKINS